jgi:hypothetical protein
MFSTRDDPEENTSNGHETETIQLNDIRAEN